MASSYSEDKLVEQPAISLFGEMHWNTLDCYNETYGKNGTHGREHRGEIVLKSKLLLRFLFASQPAIMGKALGIVYRAISTYITKKAGYRKTTAHTGAVTLMQRFGSAINLNVHFPSLGP